MPTDDRAALDDALAGLRQGDCTRLTPLFGDPAHPSRAESRIVDWVEAGAFAEHPDALAEALTCACWLGRTGVAAHLLDRGVDPAAGTATGLDALHWAANRGQLAAVRLLLARGASPETVSSFGGTALRTAVWSAIHEPRPDHLAIVGALLAAGARPERAGYPTGHARIDALLRARLAVDD
jgi:hypothetical protein